MVLCLSVQNTVINPICLKKCFWKLTLSRLASSENCKYHSFWKHLFTKIFIPWTTKKFMKNTHGMCLTTRSVQLASNGSKLFISALSSHRCFNSKAYCLRHVSRELLSSWISSSTVFEQEVCDAILVTAAIIHALVSEVTKVFFSRLCSFIKITSGSTSVTRLKYSPNTYSQTTDKICI